LVGDSYSANEDAVYYLSSGAEEVGFLTYDSTNGHGLFNNTSWDTITSASAHSGQGFRDANASDTEAQGFQLYRAISVPEPTTLAIFALGMIGLASRRIKKQP